MKRRSFIQAGVIGSTAATPLVSVAGRTLRDLDHQILQTPLCELLQIRYPILQAGMADVAGPELVAAVSNAGGLGILSATMVPPDTLKDRIARIRVLTDKPFGVNLILHQDLFPPAEFEMQDADVLKVNNTLNAFRHDLGIPESTRTPGKLPPLIETAYRIILEEKVPVFSIGLGNPTPEMVSECHDKGITVIAMACTLEDASTLASHGVDVIIAQGSEAGGHRSTWVKQSSPEYAAIGTLPLTAACVETLQVPVVAAGGIVNGKGLRAALALGAQGILMGTRFVATRESMAAESYKQALIAANSNTTTVTDVFTGMYARVIRNTFTEDYAKSNTPVLPPGRQYAATVDIVKAAGTLERPEYAALYAGQGIDQIMDIPTAGDLIATIIKEARAN